MRPRGELELHAYLTDEAIDLEESLLPLPLRGRGSDGQAGTAVVHIPQPFTFLLMKLHAFADRAKDANRDLGRHHAADVYRIVAMLTSEEYDAVRAGIERHRGAPAVRRAREIVSTAFNSPTALGIVRLREHGSPAASAGVDPLIGALTDLFRP